MTKRLEEAIRELTPNEVEELIVHAERIRRARATAEAARPRYLSMSWAGKGADLYPEHRTGVDAAHAAADLLRESIERNLAK